MNLTGAGLKRLVAMTIEAYPAEYNVTPAKTGALWMKKDTFLNVPDDVMETALISCINYCKRFPTVAEIREAIRDLQWEEESKPKQIAYEVKRTESLQQKMYDMATGKVSAKEYLQNLDISKQLEYAKTHFPDISSDLVLRNLPEIMQGMEQQEKCFACRMQKQACEGYRVVHWLNSKTGYISNQMAKCEKVERR